MFTNFGIESNDFLGYVLDIKNFIRFGKKLTHKKQIGKYIEFKISRYT